jgi:hypothetical protein
MLLVRNDDTSDEDDEDDDDDDDEGDDDDKTSTAVSNKAQEKIDVAEDGRASQMKIKQIQS